MLSTKMVQRCLVLLGELSYLEHAPLTQTFATGLSDIYRYCAAEQSPVSVKTELKMVQKLIDLLSPWVPACSFLSADTEAGACSNMIVPGTGIALVSEAVCGDPLTTPRYLTWSGNRFLWRAKE